MELTHARPRGRVLTLVIACCTLATLLTPPGVGTADAATSSGAAHSQTVTLPVPPASSFAGNSGGDGWDVSLDATRVYNVFHHGYDVQLACQEQADASSCGPEYPKTVLGPTGERFYSANHSATELDLATGKLFTWGIRHDETAGVVCIDTTVPDEDPNPYCGFTALTAVGASAPDGGALSGQSRIGDRWFAMSHGGSSNGELLCFDLSTEAACTGQPFVTGVSVDTYGYSSSAIGTRLLIQNSGELECIDTTTMSQCAGAGWPVTVNAFNAAPFPHLATDGTPTGVCVPDGSNPCFGFDGLPIPTPAGLTAAVPVGSYWTGASMVLGSRVYVPAGGLDQIGCFDFAAAAACPGFPLQMAYKYLYTINDDPFRPTCLWVNGDYGSSQVENFDAYGGGACGEGDIRVLVSQFVVNEEECFPAAYDSLAMLAPAPADYTSATLEFQTSGGGSTGIPDQVFTAGEVDLTGLGLESQPALPQFLIELTDPPASLGAVTLRLSWNAPYDPDCLGPDTEIDPAPTSLGTSVSAGGSSGPAVDAPSGSTATATSTLTGDNAAGAGGTVTYTWFSDAACTTVASAGAPLDITSPGVLPSSAPVALPDGTYRVVASYSGDVANDPSSVGCPHAAVLTLATTGGPAFTCRGGTTVAQALAAGLNVVEGTARGEVLVGTSGPDVIFGRGGNDTIRGLAGDDCILAGGGLDYVSGGSGNDIVFGQSGSDKLDGNSGDDQLHGGYGSFSIIDGGTGTDTCTSLSRVERHTRCES